MNKNDIVVVKLQIKAGQANPAPPVGPALGQRGVNIMDFCKQFNARTKDKDKTMLLPVLIMVKRDKTFSFIVKEPPVSSLLLKYANITKGSSTAGRDSCGKVSMSDINAIAKIKINELMGASIEGAERMICATAKSMGIEVI